jgi:hypothetical protein
VKFPRGQNIPLSPARRLVCDIMHASRRVPMIAMDRQLAIADVVKARRDMPVRPSWFAVFAKAYAIVSERNATLRQAYMSFPRPHLHQHGGNIAHLAIARPIGNEDGVLGLKIRHPERRPLAEIDTLIRRARTEPVERMPAFRRSLRLASLPTPVRRLAWWAALNVSANWRVKHFGTFGLTAVGALGAMQATLLSPLTTTLTYGKIAPDGSIPVRLFYDHRVLDGIGPARALADLERVLCGPILAEMRGERLRRRDDRCHTYGFPKKRRSPGSATHAQHTHEVITKRAASG